MTEVTDVSDDADERQIIATICELAKIGTLMPDQDIYDAGVSSMQALQLLVELESVFTVTLPDDAFIQARTVRALKTLIQDQRAP